MRLFYHGMTKLSVLVYDCETYDWYHCCVDFKLSLPSSSAFETEIRWASILYHYSTAESRFSHIENYLARFSHRNRAMVLAPILPDELETLFSAHHNPVELIEAFMPVFCNLIGADRIFVSPRNPVTRVCTTFKWMRSEEIPWYVANS